METTKTSEYQGMTVEELMKVIRDREAEITILTLELKKIRNAIRVLQEI